MKRRTEETVKQEQGQAGVYCGQPRSRTSSGNGFVIADAAPSALATHSSARILSSLSGNGAVATYSSGPPKATERSETLTGNIQYSSTSYSGNIPGSCVSTAVKVHGCLSTSASPTCNPIVSSTVTSSAHQFQRLKVEDALSYLDQVKFKFGNQPQVYNDFLDIMKEFKSQSIDTPGVIQRVSNLFKGHPELIVGFNTFLPPGYKIEVQSSDQGHSFQVSVSMPSPSSVTAVPTHVAAGMVTHHLSIPANLNTAVGAVPIPATATQSNPVATGVVKPIHRPVSPTHHTAAAVASASAVYHNVTSATAATTSVPVVVASTPSPSPMVPHHHIPPSTSPLPAAAGYTSPAHSISHADHSIPQGQGQPVEFNHAINYVNKIKNRFQGQPDKYKKFLEILHTYQKEQRNMKEGHVVPGKHLTEAEVYSQVAKLFEHQDDLLAEFGQFLPDATSHQAALGARLSSSDHSTVVRRSSGPRQSYGNNPGSSRDSTVPTMDQRAGMGSSKYGHSSGQIKRSASLSSSVSGSGVSGTQSKKHKLATLRDVTITEAGKYSTLSDFAFFDKVRKALKNNEAYENFLRCLTLFNNEIVSSSELIQLVTPFLGKFPELFRWFKQLMGQSENLYQLPGSSHNASENSHSNGHHQERGMIETLEEIDYTTCKRLGASYCALPKNYRQPKCSGRTALCKEVLNDTWVSFPSWSEDSTFVTSRKTQYEEFIYRCEDERFELDLVIETNTATIRVLEGVNKKMSRMTQEELARFKLDDCLGGSSPTIHLRAVRRLYGDKAPDIIDGLKKNPAIAVPVVLRRLKSKEEEWREAQKGFNKVWREQNEKYYLKSLDHQGINFKQNDLKALRSKSLFNEIEVIFDERHEQAEEAPVDVLTGPHLFLPYKNKCILDDTANLLIHHVKRQTSIHKEEKHQIKLLLKHLVNDMFFHPRQELSEDEREEDDKTNVSKENASSNAEQSCRNTSSDDLNDQEVPDIKKPDVSLPHHAKSSHPGESYTLFYCNNYWYLFLRLHQILCERLAKMYERARVIAIEESIYRKDRKESTAVALRLKPKSEIEVEDYYPAFLDMIKNVLDGNMDNSTFEDNLREMFGIYAYLSFTIDKVITYAVRQLQYLVTDETCRECLDLYNQEKKHGGAGGDCKTAYLRISAEQSYQRKAEKLLTKENCFKVVIYKQDCQLTVELLDTEENPRPEAESDEKWPAFGEGYSASAADGVGGSQTSATVTASEIRDRDDDRMDLSAEDNDELESEIGSAKRRKPVFLPRNVRLWRRRSGHLSMLTDCVEDRIGDKKNSCEVEGKQDIDENQESVRKNSASSDEDTNHGSTTNQKENVTSAPEVRAADSTFCNFNINQYRMVFVINKENYLYRRHAFRRAHQLHSPVSLRLGVKFHRWHVGWVAANVSEIQHQTCLDWFMGRGDTFFPNRTRVLTDNDLTKFQAIQQLCSTNDDLENERNSILRPTSIEPVFTELLSATKDIHVGWLLSHAGKNTCRHLSLALDKHEPGWEDLAAELGISLKLIMDIRYNESNLREGPTYTILCIYAYKKGATIGKLLEALRTIRRDDLLCILKECVIGENGLIEQLRAEAERWNKDDYINNELNSTSSDVISFFSTPSLPPLPIKYEEFSTSELLKTRNFSENIVERRVCSERMVTRAITKSEKNDVMVKKPKKKTRYKAIVMLTFSVDGFSHAETITSVLREKNIGVLILNEHRDRLVSNPELFITELFPQVNYIIPIVTKGYLDALTAASFTEGPLTSCADALYVKLIYTLMANQYVRDGCINLKVRCIVPDGSEWLMQQHPVVRNRLVLQAWLPQREIDVLADSIISTSGARSEE